MTTRHLLLSLLLIAGCYNDSQILQLYKHCYNSLWIWEFPQSMGEKHQLIMSAKRSNISFLFMNLYSSQTNSQGYNLPEFASVEAIDAMVVLENMSIWAVYGTPQWIHAPCDSNIVPLVKGIIAYKLKNTHSAIMGIVLDIEPTEPVSTDTFIAMLELFKCTKEFLREYNLQLGIAFRFFWTDSIYFNNRFRPVYQHIINLADLPIIMAYRDFAGSQCPDNGIICLSEPVVEYASSIGKPIMIGVETKDCVPDCGPEHVTFYEEGQRVLNQEMTKVYEHFSDFKIGFSIHAYQQEYLSGKGEWQSTNPKFPCSKM